MIVIAIIAIIAAIAIPNLKDARKAANEAGAIAMLRAVHSAQNVYREQDVDGNGTLDYCVVLNDLDNDYGLLPGLTNGVHGGYLFNQNHGTSSLFLWSARAYPDEVGESGDRWFYVDQTGVIRYCVQVNGGSGKVYNWPAIGK